MENLVGKTFGRLKVIDFNRRQKVPGGTRLYWDCECSCGTFSIVAGPKLKTGHTRSCGCYQRLRAAQARTIHGGSSRKGKHPLYRMWYGMIERCRYKKHVGFKYYGGRGITVCERWKSFGKFKDDMEGTWSPGLTIERININGNYEPNNCVWIPMSEQAKNTRSNRHITYRGKTLILSDWARKFGIHPHTISCRIKRGWSIKRSLTEPSHF